MAFLFKMCVSGRKVEEENEKMTNGENNINSSRPPREMISSTASTSTTTANSNITNNTTTKCGGKDSTLSSVNNTQIIVSRCDSIRVQIPSYQQVKNSLQPIKSSSGVAQSFFLAPSLLVDSNTTPTTPTINNNSNNNNSNNNNSNNNNNNRRRNHSCGNILTMDGRLWIGNRKDILIHVHRKSKPLGIEFLTFKRDWPVVGELFHEGAICLDGRISPGDQIIEVNGVSLFGRNLTEINEILNEKKFLIMVCILFRPYILKPITMVDAVGGDYNFENSPDLRCIQVNLKRPHHGVPFGLELIQMGGLRPGIYVKRVMKQFHSGVGDYLMPGDWILKIDKYNMRECAGADLAATYIKMLPSPIKLIIARRDEDVIISNPTCEVLNRSLNSGLNDNTAEIETVRKYL